MTNEEIIFRQGQELAKAGKIWFTGRTLVIKTEDGGEVEVLEAEPIHTFAAWKELGFSVKKGEHAVAKFPVWKYRGKKDEETGEEEGRMFMKTAHFFALSQVQRGCEA